MADDGLGTVETTQLEASLWVLRLVGEHDLSITLLLERAYARLSCSCRWTSSACSPPRSRSSRGTV